MCSVCSSQSEAFQLPISPSLSLSHTLHFLTILGLAIYYMLCTLLVVSILKEAGYICVCIHAVDLEFQWLSTLRYNTSHSHLLLTLILHSTPSPYTILHVQLTPERGWVGNDMYRRGIRCSLALLCILIHRACP